MVARLKQGALPPKGGGGLIFHARLLCRCFDMTDHQNFDNRKIRGFAEEHRGSSPASVKFLYTRRKSNSAFRDLILTPVSECGFQWFHKQVRKGRVVRPSYLCLQSCCLASLLSASRTTQRTLRLPGHTADVQSNATRPKHKSPTRSTLSGSTAFHYFCALHTNIISLSAVVKRRAYRTATGCAPSDRRR